MSMMYVIDRDAASCIMEYADPEEAVEPHHTLWHDVIKHDVMFAGTSIMEYEIQIGWGKSVRVPPQPVYVAPDEKEDEQAKTLDPPSGLPFNAQHTEPAAKRSKSCEHAVKKVGTTSCDSGVVCCTLRWWLWKGSSSIKCCGGARR